MKETIRCPACDEMVEVWSYDGYDKIDWHHKLPYRDERCCCAGARVKTQPDGSRTVSDPIAVVGQKYLIHDYVPRTALCIRPGARDICCALFKSSGWRDFWENETTIIRKITDEEAKDLEDAWLAGCEAKGIECDVRIGGPAEDDDAKIL